MAENKKEVNVCYSSEGKYIVNGKEINIDYDDIESIPIDLLKKLEQSNMNQLDALYLRKRMHSLTNSIQKLFMQIDLIEESVPKIANIEVHKVVNGKFDKISNSLDKIIIRQQEYEKNDLDKVVTNEELIAKIEEKIDYLGSKTIFGWMKNRFEKKPLSTILIAALSGILTFVLIMRIFNIESFADLFSMVEKWRFW